MDTPLRRLRKQTGLSGAAFAAELRIATQHLHALESGETGMQLKTAVKLSRGLAHHLGVKPSKVLAELTQIDKRTAATEKVAA